MTAVLPRPAPPRTPSASATPRRYLMCRPEHFTVSYAINPWMDVTRGADRDLAVRQWETLRQTYLALGHEVELIDPGARPAGHGLRRQRRPGHRGPRARRPVHPRRAARRGPGLPAPAGDAGPEGRHRAGARQRGRGRLPRRRRAGPGRHRLPHRPGRAHRGPGAVRRPGDLAAAGRPALLPPGHGAGRARRPRRSPTTRRRSARAAGRSCSGCSRTRSWPPRPTPSSSA